MIYHAYSAYIHSSPDVKRRLDFAKSTWSLQPWVDLPLPDSIGRRVEDELSGVPCVKEIVDFAANDKQSSDIVVLTNTDICCSSDCCVKIVCGLMFSDAVCCKRRNFPKLTRHLASSEISSGVLCNGLDLFAFRVGWWRSNRDEFPDMVIGRENWDFVLYVLIEITNPKRDIVLPDLIYHEAHVSDWIKPDNINRLSSQLYNRELGEPWMERRGVNPSRFHSADWK